MNILAHRGLWKNPNEMNTLEALNLAISKNLGIETDIRDHLGDIIVRHDIGIESELYLKELLEALGATDLKIALNVKASEMGATLSKLLSESKIENYFLFDLSIPDLRKYLDLGLKTYCRISEVEQKAVWSREIKGVWVDSFTGRTTNKDVINYFLDKNLEVSLVSEEIHGRDPLVFWDLISEFIEDPRVSICTDYPLELYDFMYGSNIKSD